MHIRKHQYWLTGTEGANIDYTNNIYSTNMLKSLLAHSLIPDLPNQN